MNVTRTALCDSIIIILQSWTIRYSWAYHVPSKLVKKPRQAPPSSSSTKTSPHDQWRWCMPGLWTHNLLHFRAHWHQFRAVEAARSLEREIWGEEVLVWESLSLVSDRCIGNVCCRLTGSHACFSGEKGVRIEWIISEIASHVLVGLIYPSSRCGCFDLLLDMCRVNSKTLRIVIIRWLTSPKPLQWGFVFDLCFQFTERSLSLTPGIAFQRGRVSRCANFNSLWDWLPDRIEQHASSIQFTIAPKVRGFVSWFFEG